MPKDVLDRVQGEFRQRGVTPVTVDTSEFPDLYIEIASMGRLSN